MKTLIAVAFGLVVLGLFLGSLWYVPHRLSRLFGLTRAWPVYVAFPAAVLLYPVSRGLLAAIGGAPFELLVSAASVAVGLHLFTTLGLAASDLARLAGPVPARPAAFAALGLAVAVSGFGVWRARDLAVERVEIPIAGLEREVSIVLLSDVHIGAQRGRAWLERIVRETNRLEPRLVLITGDLVDSNGALEPGVLDPLAGFEAPAFFTTGNHESYVDTARALAVIARHGVRVLRNEVVETDDLQLVGLDYMNADSESFDLHAVNALTIAEELPKLPIDKGKPSVLMHHSPVGLEYVAKAGVSLMLSGHTHGGQMFPATLIARLLFPLNEGLHRRGGTWFYVSRGAGTFGPMMRLGTRNEINLLRLVPARPSTTEN